MNKKYPILKQRAIKLRKLGLSYNEIKKEIKISKSTLSLWLRHIELSKSHRDRLYTKQIKILSLGPQSQRERRHREIEKIISQAESEIALPLSYDAHRFLGAALYWAEGSKNKMFEMTNSDPYLILFFTHWVEKIFKIPSSELRARLNIYPQQNEIKIKKFWSDLTGIPFKSFGKSYVKPISTGYKKNNLYYGTIRIEVPKSTDIRHRVFGWIKAALKDVDPEVQLVERRWQSLRKTPRPINLNS